MGERPLRARGRRVAGVGLRGRARVLSPSRCRGRRGDEAERPPSSRRYFAVNLLARSRALGARDDALADWAQLLLGLELAAARRYWHLGDAGDAGAGDAGGGRDGAALAPLRAAAGGVVGVVGALDAVAATWFGDAPEYAHLVNAGRVGDEAEAPSPLLRYAHLVNAIPFVPGLSDALLSPRFVREAEWPQLAALVRARAGAEDRARGGGDERDGADVAASSRRRGAACSCSCGPRRARAAGAPRARRPTARAPLGPLDSGSSRAALLC